MASLSGICSSSPTLKKFPNQSPSLTDPLRKDHVSFPARLADRTLSLAPLRAVAREVSDGALAAAVKKGLEKDPRALWRRYVGWLYQHKELGIYLDVSRVGFSDEFVKEMEPRFQAAFRAMEELEKGAIANPDEGRMVGHYWLRDPKRAPTAFLKTQIENTLDAVCKFANDVVSGKVSSVTSPSFVNSTVVLWMAKGEGKREKLAGSFPSANEN